MAMRVLFVNETATMSGAEQGLLAVLRHLPAGVEAAVACPEGELADRVRAEGIEVLPHTGPQLTLRRGSRSLVRGAMATARSRRQLRRVVARHRPDVVHANSVRAGITAILACGRRVPVVTSVHDCLPANARTRVARVLLAFGSRALVYNSEHTRRRMRVSGAPGMELVAYSPVEVGRFAPARSARDEIRRRLGVEGRVVLAVAAQITPWKGQDDAIRILAALRAQGVDATLLIVGSVKFSGPQVRHDNVAYVRELEALVAELGLTDHVRFVGELSDVGEVMAATDVLLVPSWEEPFGRVVVEGVLAGTKVLATDNGGPREILTPETGRTLPPCRPAVWAEAVRELVDGGPSPTSPEAARAVGERFDPAAHVTALERCWRTVAPDHDGGHRVLFVNHTGRTSGGEHSLVTMLRYLPRDVVPAVMAPEGPLVESLDRSMIPSYRLLGTDGSLRLDPVETPKAAARLLADSLRLRARTNGDTVVHANSIRAGLIAGMARLLGGVPPVVHVRDCLPPGPAAQLPLRFVGHTAGLVVANSSYTAAHNARVAELGEQAVVHSPVDLVEFDPDRHDGAAVRRELGVPPDAFVAGIVGQITPWKGHMTAVRAVAGLDAGLLLVVGSTKFAARNTRYDNVAFEQELEAEVERLGVRDRVMFLGERADVAALIAAMDVLLMPSEVEPLGRAMLEGMAMGRPILATDRGGPAEVLTPSRAGTLLPPDEPDRWTEELRRLRDDPEERRAMGRRGRAHVTAEFSAERLTDRLLEVWAHAPGW